MRNLLLLLIVANILYFIWGRFSTEPMETGVAIVDESELGPPLSVTKSSGNEIVAGAEAVENSAKPTVIAALTGRSCVTIGPFKSNAEADGALTAYDGEGMRASVRTTQGQVFVGHWVQIRNIPDKATGDIMLQKLRAGGLGDSYLVEDETEGFKISLGLFGAMSGAERIELQAKSMDLPADITPRMREATVFFVDIGLPPGKGAGAIIEKYGEDKVMLRNKATCPRAE